MAYTISINRIENQLAVDHVSTANFSVIGRGYDIRNVSFYDGTKPATVDTAITTQNLLARITHSATPWPSSTFSASNIKLAYNTSSATPTYEFVASGTITWFRIYSVEGHALFDGTVGTSDADLVLKITTIVDAEDEIFLSTFDIVAPHKVWADGTMAQTLPTVTQAVTGKVWIVGTAAQTLPSMTQAATGTVTGP